MLQSNNPLDEYLTKSELATILRKSTRTLDRWDLTGDGPPKVQIGRTVLYRRESISEWLRSCERCRAGKKRGAR